MEQIKKSSPATLFLLLLILFAAQETMVVVRAAESCGVLSGTFKGPCWEFASGARCDNCCKNEGHASGSCMIDFRCWCVKKDCQPA